MTGYTKHKTTRLISDRRFHALAESMIISVVFGLIVFVVIV